MILVKYPALVSTDISFSPIYTECFLPRCTSLRSYLSSIGFKIAQKIRNHVLGRPAAFNAGLVYGGTKENVTVRDIRVSQGMGPEILGRLFAGPGFSRDLGDQVWGLIHGVDAKEVAKVKEVPQQISIVSCDQHNILRSLLIRKVGRQLHQVK